MQRRSQYTIRDAGSSLLIRSQARWKAWHRPAVGVAVGLAGSIVLNELYHSAWCPVVGLVLGVGAYFSEPGVSWAQLRISALECHTIANFSKSLKRGRTVLTGDILWLEYNEQGFSMHDGPGRAGLYAARRSGSICLLPLLDGQQTTEIIVAIENKFPGLAGMWRKHSPWSKAVQTTGLV
jgi:hypothetical protein